MSNPLTPLHLMRSVCEAGVEVRVNQDAFHIPLTGTKRWIEFVCKVNFGADCGFTILLFKLPSWASKRIPWTFTSPKWLDSTRSLHWNSSVLYRLHLVKTSQKLHFGSRDQACFSSLPSNKLMDNDCAFWLITDISPSTGTQKWRLIVADRPRYIWW